MSSSSSSYAFAAIVVGTSCCVWINRFGHAKEAVLASFVAFDDAQELRRSTDRGLSAKLRARAGEDAASPVTEDDVSPSTTSSRNQRQHFGVLGELLSMWFPSAFFDEKGEGGGAQGGQDDRLPMASATAAKSSGGSTSSTGSGTKNYIRPSICFQGSGCVLVYHIGVARYVEDHFDCSDVCFLGASGGAIIAAMMALDLDMDFAMKENCRVAKFSRMWPFGPFGRILDDVACAFETHLTTWDDAKVESHLAGGRLVLSMTHMLTGAARLMLHYPTKRHAIDSVWCSMNLPIFMCPFRRVEGEFFLDGGLTNNAPVLDSHTIRVSPTDRSADVRPAVGPTLKEFLVPGDDDYMEYMHDEGYADAARAHGVFVEHGFRPRVASKRKWVKYLSKAAHLRGKRTDA